jgi:DNA-directed RNA polymerase specialized sigma24 family protein
MADTPVGHPFRLFEAHARHHDVIERYVANRVPDPELAQQVVAAVHQQAAERIAEAPEHLLPWLIAIARHECARVRRAEDTRRA